MANDASYLDDVPFSSAKVDIYSLNYDQTFTFSIEKEEVEKNNVARTETEEVVYRHSRERLRARRQAVEWNSNPDLPENTQGWAHRFLPTWRLYFGDVPRRPIRPTHSTPYSQDEEYDWDKYFAWRLEEIWRQYSNSLLSQIRGIQEQGITSILQGILAMDRDAPAPELEEMDIETIYRRVSDFVSRQGSANILGDLNEFKERYENSAQLRSVVRDINKIEERIEHERAPRDQLEYLIEDMFSGPKEIKFEDHGILVYSEAGKDIGLPSLSSGEKHVMTLFIEVLLSESNSILIDEPEISLHIDWQRRLTSAMHRLNPNAQIILTTHAPEIMAKVSDDCIFNL